MRSCTSCGRANSDAARFCKGCGSTLVALSPAPPGLRVTMAPLVVGSIGLIIWGLGSFPWAINPSLYQHNSIVKLTYIAWGVGPILVAIGLLMARSVASERIGGTPLILGTIGLFIIGVSQFPSIAAQNTSVAFRVDYGGPAIGYILLGVGLVAAIPTVAKR